MTSTLGQVQGWILLTIGVLAWAAQLWAFIDALRRRPDAFVAADKRTKTFWLIILGVAAAVGFATFTSPMGLLGLLGIIAAAVYFADVKPALDRVTGAGRRQQGPYGPW